MTNLVNELAELGLVHETKGVSRHVGRRPSLLAFDAAAGTAAGVEVSRTGVRGLLTDLAGDPLRRAEIERPAAAGRDAVLDAVHRVLEDLLAGGARPVGIGVGVPGPVDSARGIVIEPPNFPGWHHEPLAANLERRFRIPVWLDDDAKTAALGEQRFGAGRRVANMLYVSVGTGIGAGLIVRDELYRGTHELAGEIGHSTLDLDGPLCECGNRGCLETLVSIPAILAAARRAGVDAPSAAALHALAAAGDPAARLVKERALAYLAAGVVNAVNFYDPDLIVLGGGLVAQWPDLCDEIAARVRGRSFGFASLGVRIVPALLGADSSALGAASLVVDRVVEALARLARAAAATALVAAG